MSLSDEALAAFQRLADDQALDLIGERRSGAVCGWCIQDTPSYPCGHRCPLRTTPDRSYDELEHDDEPPTPPRRGLMPWLRARIFDD